MSPLDKPLYRFRISTAVETGPGNRLWLTWPIPITAESRAQAERVFATRLKKNGVLSMRIEDFDLTGPASELADAIDIVWTNDVKAERIF